MVPVYYSGVQVGSHTLDLVVAAVIVVELKAVSIPGRGAPLICCLTFAPPICGSGFC